MESTFDNPVFVYDFTLGKKFVIDTDQIKIWLREHCKKWSFQLEKGDETGYLHYQGRLSLKVRQRKHTVLTKLPWKEITLTHTSNNNMGNDFYVTKEETRMDGPWKDTDPVPLVLPPHLAAIVKWTPLQDQILFLCAQQKIDPFNRELNALIDPDGKHGKSILVDSICIRKLGIKLPPLNNYKDLMQYFHSKDLSVTEPTIVFFDMPRALKKEHMHQLYSACETIKDGWAYDTRYGNRDDKWFARPVMWIFMNDPPDVSLLTKDRWRLWTLDDKGLLTPYVENILAPVDNINTAQTRSVVQQVTTKFRWDEVVDQMYGNNPRVVTFPLQGAEF